ncbi:FAD-binding oxidoreductase [uncultured Ramlibacter sp.]|uniref:FAD-binding oxidoreductase n=1 Tax=uncultured Ramlibacter sp. TaxID=260755 RepID=UPI00261B1BBF|nr:FAD-binding oxidoreductase [uncultured Ramlibacter sp.]
MSVPAHLSRRSFLCQSLAAAGLLAGAPAALLAVPPLQVANVTGLYTVQVARIAVPTSVMELAAQTIAWRGQVAVGGGRYSMGGQVAIEGGLHVDMRRMNALLWVRPAQRMVRVQAGMRWRDLQDVLDPLGLAVETMQSYSNFSIGGSVSVNAHGRYVGNGPVGNSVTALQLMLVDGSLVEATPHNNTELFRAAIGGYGALAVITEVELRLARNEKIERRVDRMPLQDYLAFFDAQVAADSAAILHNADLAPPLFDAPVAVTWRRSDKALTEPARLVPRGVDYAKERTALWAMTELPKGSKLRQAVVDPLVYGKQAVVWRNHEASLDVAQLEPRSRRQSTYVLQEYFIPRRRFESFARQMGPLLQRRQVEAVNVSVRHSPADAVALLPWAREEVFSFVLYYKQRTDDAAMAAVGEWTRELVELALLHEGRYYLPYQMHASREQFDRAYPEAAGLRALKQRVDPAGKFSNSLWRKYL